MGQLLRSGPVCQVLGRGANAPRMLPGQLAPSATGMQLNEPGICQGCSPTCLMWHHDNSKHPSKNSVTFTDTEEWRCQARNYTPVTRMRSCGSHQNKLKQRSLVDLHEVGVPGFDVFV